MLSTSFFPASLQELCCLTGLIISIVGSLGLHSGVGFAVRCVVTRNAADASRSYVTLPSCLARSWLCYLSVYIVGQSFLSFQWDILLLEVGFLAIFAARPLPFSGTGRLTSLFPSYSPPFVWLTKFLLFKLVSTILKWLLSMLLLALLMAIVFECDADANGWCRQDSGALPHVAEPDRTRLSLRHHRAFCARFAVGVLTLTWPLTFAQCIPNPLSWYAHQLPPAIQSWSVAGTILIEIPATILILMPFKVRL